jgi:hypothetical protein
LNAIVLAPRDPDRFGYHRRGVVHVCAWENSLWRVFSAWLYEREKDVLCRLGVECQLLADYVAEQESYGVPASRVFDALDWEGPDSMLCKFSAKQVRAFQLLGTLLHDLGHHHDLMTTRSRREASRGEAYAEEYARRHEALIWQEYLGAFALY